MGKGGKVLSQQEMSRKVGGTTYHREVPDGRLLREAAIYVMYSNSLQEFLSLERVENIKRFSPHLDGWRDLGPHRKLQDMPKIPFWHYEIFETDAAGVQASRTDYLITDDRADWLTDIFCWTPFTVVREKVRDFLEDTDPGGNAFFPVKIFTKESREELPGQYFNWLPKRRLFPSIDLVPQSDVVVRKPYGSDFGGRKVASEFQFNTELKHFAKELPSFGINFGFQAAFNADLFKALKAEKFTGLVERKHCDPNKRDNKHWNVDHIFL